MYPVTPSSAVGEVSVLSATLKVLLLAAIFSASAPHLSLVGLVQNLLNFGRQMVLAVQRPAACHCYN